MLELGRCIPLGLRDARSRVFRSGILRGNTEAKGPTGTHLSADFIPRTLEDLSAEWLTRVLRQGGHLETARVTAAKLEVIGRGEGMLSLLVRVHLSYDRREPDAPDSLIAKLPSAVRKNRASAEVIGAYERENDFYARVVPHFPIRVPKLYYSAMDPNPIDADPEAGARFFNRIPMWQLRWLMGGLLWLSRFSRRRYALLIEDLAEMRMGDQVGGGDRHDWERALRALASVHAAFWQSHRLDEYDFLPRIWDSARPVQVLFQRALPGFRRHYWDALPHEVRELAGWLTEHAVDATRSLAQGPATLVHMDYRLDNLFFDDDTGEVIVFDFQAVCVGPGVLDVANFLGTTLPPELCRQEELDLVRLYHRSLVAGGVDDYSQEQCLLDYERAISLQLQRLVSGLNSVEFDSERSRQVVSTWLKRLVGRLGGVSS